MRSARYLAIAAASVAAFLSAPAQAFVVPATGIPGFLPATGGLAGGTLTGGGFLNGAATRTALTNAAGKIISVPLTLTVGPTASRTIAAACFASPVLCGAAAVGGTAIAAWFLLSKIYQDDAGVYQKDTVTRTAGICWRVPNNPVAPCLESPTAAVQAVWVSSYGRVWVSAAENSTSPDGTLKGITVTYYQGSYGIEYGSESWVVQREFGEVERTETAPASQVDIETHATEHPLTAPSTVSDNALNASPIPVAVESPNFQRTTEPLGAPYKAASPATGYRQDQVRIDGKPDTADPLDLEATPETVVADDPSTPEDESKTEGATDPEKLEDPCKLHPDTAGCVPLGTLSASKLPSVTVTPTITKTGGWQESAQCPAPTVVETALVGQIVVPWTLFCTAADYARPVVLGIAYVIAIFGFMGLARRD